MSINWNEYEDKGCVIARFYLNFTKNLWWVRFWTRLTVGILYSLICLPQVLLGVKSPFDMPFLAFGIPIIVNMELGKTEEILIGCWILFWFLIGLNLGV